MVQLEEICKHLEAICLENKSLKAQSPQREANLQGIIDHLKSERDSLCNELSSYTELMKTERSKFDDKLKASTEVNLRLSQELDDATAKIRQTVKVEAELRNAMIEVEATCTELKSQLKSVTFQLKNKDRNIERLESEITKEAEDEHLASEALKLSKKENIQLNNELRTLKANYEATESSVEDLRTQLSAITLDLRAMTKELSRKTDETQSLMDELDIAKETNKELKERLAKVKEDYSRQYTDRIQTLQDEKRELEDRLKEVHDETSDTKSLFDNPSLREELSQLDDFKPAQVSRLFNSFGDNKKLETLKSELAEKDSLIESLTKSRDELQASLTLINKQLFKATRSIADLEQSKSAEIDRLKALVSDLQSQKPGQDVGELQFKIIELQGEIQQLAKELTSSKLQSSEEIKRLTVALRDSEFKGAEIRMQYYEAIQELKVLKQQSLGGSQPKGAMSRISNLFKRA